MKKSIWTVGALSIVAAALILVGCGTHPVTTAEGYTLVNEGKLTVLSDLSYPPLDSVPEGGTAEDAEGYEVDLVDAIAAKLGLEVEWEQVKFDTIIPLIKQGSKADIGASAFTITDDREDEVDFTDPYLNSNQGLVMKVSDAVDDPATYLNQSSMRIAVQSGTSGESWAEENLPNAQIVALDDVVQAMTGVQAGLYNACVADLPVVQYMTQESYTDLEVVAEIPTGEQYAFVVSQDNPKLTEAIDKAYEELVDDGTVAELQLQWFGEEL